MGCFCDYDPPEFYSQRWHTARKRHVCCECNRPIEPGQSYQRTVGKWDGHIDSFITCERCADIADALKELGYCVAHGDLVSDYEAHLDAIGSERTALEILST